MGHFLSRAIKRFTQCNNNARNQLRESHQSNQEQQTATTTGQRGQDSGKPTVQSIPVGQSIDSAEYAAFKSTSSSIDRNRDNSTSTSQNEQSTPVDDLNLTDKNETKSQKESAENESNEQNKPQVEEAVIKIQALVRGHLTRKALKDAQQQAAMIPPNALGQSQFDEESLRNPPNALFSNVSPPPQATNTSNLSGANNNQQQSNKPANNRVPPLESIAEDVESTNATRMERKLSSPKGASDTSGDSVESQSTSPSNEANASIDLHCDTPASASIDIMDHSTRLMPAIAAVLHHREPSSNQEIGFGGGGGELVSTQSREVSANSNNNNFESQNGLSSRRLVDSLVDGQRQTITTSSLPSSPPHINLALATNSHSIDSAEAAAIRIQSAFRGYHTRKHSPYRRRSPASAPVDQINNGPSANGQPKRNALRQQNATILDDDDDNLHGHEDQPNNVDECQPPGDEATSNCCLEQGASSEEGNEELRQSRERHRTDETLAQVSHDEMTSNDDQSTVKELPGGQNYTKNSAALEMEQEQTVLSAAAAAAALTSAEQGEQWSNKLSGLAPAEALWSTSLDTDSSNLGAALSLNEDISEGILQAPQGGDGGDLSGHRESLGAAIEDTADSDLVDRSGFGHVSESSASKQLDELETATDQLEAALEGATDNEAYSYGYQLAANLADNCLDDESQQNLNELESDDIERRHPSGVVSELEKQFDDQPQQQAALEATNSLENQEQNQEVDVRDEQQMPEFDVNQQHSPDEEARQGLSPPLVGSNDGNSSGDGADSDQDQDGQQQPTGTTRPADSQQGGSNKNRKRNRNKRKGKK